MTKEERGKFDQDLEKAAHALRGEDAPPRSRQPSWWKGDVAAGQSMLDAARNMGLVVGEVK